MHLFLEKYISLTRRDELRDQFKLLQKDCVSVNKYERRFTELFCHAAFLILAEAEKARRCIEGLSYDSRVAMARGSEIGTTFHQVVEIAQRIERIRIQVRKAMMIEKRPRRSESFSAASSKGRGHFGGGHFSKPVHSSHHPAHGTLVQFFSVLFQ